MKSTISETIQIPSGVECKFENKILSCKKGSVSLTKEINVPKLKVSVSGNEIVLSCDKGNKIKYKIAKSLVAHITNLFNGLDNEYVYILESCNVHFPMTLKLEKDRLLINNFLGEKMPRVAEIVPGVKVDIKGQKITVSSHQKEDAGQTAANIEKATKVRNRDRRVFQDGIYIIERPGGAS